MRQPDLECLLLWRQPVEANRHRLPPLHLCRTSRHVDAYQIASGHSRLLNPPTVDQQIHDAVGTRWHAYQHNPCPQQVEFDHGRGRAYRYAHARGLRFGAQQLWVVASRTGGTRQAVRKPAAARVFELCEPTEQLDGDGMRDHDKPPRGRAATLLQSPDLVTTRHAGKHQRLDTATCESFWAPSATRATATPEITCPHRARHARADPSNTRG